MSAQGFVSFSERQLSDGVASLADLFGWMRYHTHDSRHSAPGFPDWILIRPPRLIVTELKSQNGKVTEAQQLWLHAWAQVQGAEVFVWRPADWVDGTIESVLR